MYVVFFNDTATTEIYTLSLHDALPISRSARASTASAAGGAAGTGTGTDTDTGGGGGAATARFVSVLFGGGRSDRKSTRLNSSHANIPYSVFCLKKKIITSSLLTIIHTH